MPIGPGWDPTILTSLPVQLLLYAAFFLITSALVCVPIGLVAGISNKRRKERIKAKGLIETPLGLYDPKTHTFKE